MMSFLLISLLDITPFPQESGIIMCFFPQGHEVSMTACYFSKGYENDVMKGTVSHDFSTWGPTFF